MKTKILIFTLICMSYAKVEAKKVNGEIIYNNDSIVHVTFDISISLIFQEVNVESIQHGIEYYNSLGKTVELEPESAKEIRFKYNYEDFRLISCVDNLNLSGYFFPSNEKLFLRLRNDGKLRLYTYYFTKVTPAMSNGVGGTIPGSSYNTDRFILQKNNGDLFEPRWLRFRKDMKKYLSDCPKVVAKIDDRTYTRDLINIIVMEYNGCRY
jgi:hypothetical protein